MAADPRFAQFVETPEPVADLLEENVAMIWTYADENEIDDQDAEQRPFGVVVPEFKHGVEGWVSIDPAYRVRRSVDQPFVVEIDQPAALA